MLAVDEVARAIRAALLATLAYLVVATAALAADPPAEKIPPPQEITLKTVDGAVLVATYYPSNKGKDAVPVILLHASHGTRGNFEQLALMLQRGGCAVMAPDLRGHGDSTRGRAENRTGDLKPADYAAMVERDMEVIKSFLMTKNNEGELNIEKLCVVGVEMGAAVALNWAALDWSWPLLTTGKQGQDVKALVLVSPEWSFRGLRINEAVGDQAVRTELSALIVAGKGNSKSLAEAKRLHAALEKYHPEPPAELANEQQMIFFQTPSTSLQGTRLLNEKSLHLDQMIAKFIELRLVKKQIPWSERKRPVE